MISGLSVAEFERDIIREQKYELAQAQHSGGLVAQIAMQIVGEEGMGHGPEDYFKAGVLLLKRGIDREAAQAFRKALEMEPTEPRYLSYFGLCLARIGMRRKEATRLCEEAAQKEFYRPEIWLNLGRVYLLAGDHEKAYEAFRRGHRLDKADPELRTELEKMGVRRPPVFRFLGRGHALNRIAGRVRFTLSVRKKALHG